MGSSFTPVGLVAAGLSGVGLAIKGVRFYREQTGKEPSLEEWIAIASPLAYLESFNELVQTNQLLQQLGETSISEPLCISRIFCNNLKTLVKQGF